MNTRIRLGSKCGASDLRGVSLGLLLLAGPFCVDAVAQVQLLRINGDGVASAVSVPVVTGAKARGLPVDSQVPLLREGRFTSMIEAERKKKTLVPEREHMWNLLKSVWKPVNGGAAAWETWYTADELFTKEGAARSNASTAPFEPGVSHGESHEQVLYNTAAYEHIRKNQLYSKAGLTALLERARKDKRDVLISFPEDAVVLKVSWRKLETPDAAALRSHYWYYDKKRREYFGLKAFHLVTHETPNWSWATFWHNTNSHPDTDRKEYDADRPAELARMGYSASNAEGKPVSSEGPLALFRLNSDSGFRTFEDAGRQSPIVFNPYIETEDPMGPAGARSNCVDCHGAAAFNKPQPYGFARKLFLAPALPRDRPPPPPTNPDPPGVHLDFLWSIARRSI